MPNRSVEGTRPRSQEHRRAQAVVWDRGRWDAGVARIEMKKKGERDDGGRIYLVATRKNDAE